jgi:hypothetical protein
VDGAELEHVTVVQLTAACYNVDAIAFVVGFGVDGVTQVGSTFANCDTFLGVLLDNLGSELCSVLAAQL